VVTAAIDVSDGFAGDLARLCAASGVGCDLRAGSLPEDPLLARAADTLGLGAEALRFGASDDYELLLAVDPAGREACERAARETGTPISFAGQFTRERGKLSLEGAGGVKKPLDARGFDHFGGGR
jgi:thiamine-monophosphate kinase